ncbi:hypothetical protein IAT38_002533 [Cryptococcus sp. DSM 104549]
MPPSRPPTRKKRRSVRPGVCADCGCTEEGTSLWRSAPEKKGSGDRREMLCNACGIYRKTHHGERPEKWRNRGKAQSTSTVPAAQTVQQAPLPPPSSSVSSSSSSSASVALSAAVQESRATTQAQASGSTASGSGASGVREGGPGRVSGGVARRSAGGQVGVAGVAGGSRRGGKRRTGGEGPMEGGIEGEADEEVLWAARVITGWRAQHTTRIPNRPSPRDVPPQPLPSPPLPSHTTPRRVATRERD